MKIGAFKFSTLLRIGCALISTLAFAEAALAQSTPSLVQTSAPAWGGDLRRVGLGDIHSGDPVTVRVRNIGADLTISCSGKQVESPQLYLDSPLGSSGVLQFLIPQMDPGFVNCKMRSGGLDSLPTRVLIMDSAGTLTARLSGLALYQKLEVTDIGLDTEKGSLRPIRNALIEVFDVPTQTVISSSDAEGNGEFLVAVPPDSTDLVIRAVSRIRSADLKVEDNTNGNQVYSILSASIDMHTQRDKVTLVDRGRKSGAFNILEQIQRANDFVHAADPQFSPFPLTMFWSEKNQKQIGSIKDGFVGTTFFSLTGSIAYILGDRNTDSDEYDDSVLIHEYAHMLAAKFSEDDSIGGAHRLGDNLDPRVAWSEGWANFFSAAVRNDSIYRDSQGPNGATVLRFDVEENYPPGSFIGYGSETSVQSLLWDFLDDKSEPGDTAQFDFAQIWAAFKDLKSNHFVYLPYFLDHLLERNPASSDSIQRMVQAQAIDFQPGVSPSVSNPFPSYIAINSIKTGELDSLATKRTNLAQSSAFFNFTTAGGPIAIQLSVLPATFNNPNANDLDLYLFDINGKLLSKSDTGLNGRGEFIPPMALPPGSYVIEVRSYFTVKGTVVLNSGKYILRLLPGL